MNYEGVPAPPVPLYSCYSCTKVVRIYVIRNGRLSTLQITVFLLKPYFDYRTVTTTAEL